MVHTMISGDDDLDGYLRYIDTEFRPALQQVAAQFPTIVGEWSLNTSSTGVSLLSREQKRDYYRRLAGAQLSAWQQTHGWFFWSYKLQVEGDELDAWDFGKSIALGYLPTPVLSGA